ncbi:MAG: hypothetical protein U1E73_11520 [Planctomycetota bacterium]
MNKVFALLSWCALLWLLLAAVLCFSGTLAVDVAQTQFLLATIAWFATAPLAQRRG